MKKITLFGCFSAIGTIADCILLIFISLFFKGIILTVIFTNVNGIEELILTIISFMLGNLEKLDMLNKYAYSLANFISYAIGVAITFVLSAKYAFKVSEETVTKRAILTTIIHIIGIIVQTVLFNRLIWHGWDNGTAKTITIAVNAVLMGASNIFIVFRNYNKKDEKNEAQKKVSGT